MERLDVLPVRHIVLHLAGVAIDTGSPGAISEPV